MELTDKVVPTGATFNLYSPGGNTVFPSRASTGRVSVPRTVSWPKAAGPVPASAESPSKAIIPNERFEPNLFSSVFISFLLFEFFRAPHRHCRTRHCFICVFEQDRGVLGQDVLPGGATGRQELRGSRHTMLQGERVRCTYNLPVWAVQVQRKESMLSIGAGNARGQLPDISYQRSVIRRQERPGFALGRFAAGVQ